MNIQTLCSPLQLWPLRMRQASFSLLMALAVVSDEKDAAAR